jgi:predicted regulator of Ras-like GTPase activity (Roadblock/LC7/MglB family)
MSELEEALRSLQNVPGVISAVLVDADGIPLAEVGEFDLPVEDLGAILAACFESLDNLGRGMGEFYVESIIAEYSQTKLVQQKMPRGTLIVLAEKLAPVGVIRLEAKRALVSLDNLMERTVDLREELASRHKFRGPAESGGNSPASGSLLSFLEKKLDGGL